MSGQSKWRRWIAPGGIAALALAGTVALPTPAHALTGSVLAKTYSASNSMSKNATAACPPGTKVYGGAGKIVNGGGHVLITDIIPNSTLSTVQVQGGENGPYAEDWQVIAMAICAPPVPGLQRIATPSNVNGTAIGLKLAAAECPDGLQLYGTGYQLSGANGRVFINAVTPDIDLTNVRVLAQEDFAVSDVWNLWAYAICGEPEDAFSMQRIKRLTSLSSLSPKTADTAPCPIGWTVTGVGAELVGGEGEVLRDEIAPDDTLSQVTATAWEDGAFADSWQETIYSICARD